MTLNEESSCKRIAENVANRIFQILLNVISISSGHHDGLIYLSEHNLSDF